MWVFRALISSAFLITKRCSALLKFPFLTFPVLSCPALFCCSLVLSGYFYLVFLSRLLPINLHCERKHTEMLTSLCYSLLAAHRAGSKNQFN